MSISDDLHRFINSGISNISNKYGFYSISVFGVLMSSQLISCIENTAHKYADQIAIECQQQAWKFSELRQLAINLASLMYKQGVTTGQYVGLYCGSRSEFYLALLACWYLGAIAVPLNPDTPPAQLINTVNQIKFDLLLVPREMQVPNLLDQLRIFIIELENIKKNSANVIWQLPENNDIAIILFTSGSTGIPKGAMLSHHGLAGNALATAAKLKLTIADRMLMNIPFLFTSALSHFLTNLFSGSTLLALDGLLLGPQLIKMLQYYRATAFGGAPIQLARIIDFVQAAKQHDNLCDLTDLRLVMSSGDNLAASIIEKWLNVLPKVKVFTVYGLTELGGRFCFLEPEYLPQKIGSVGKPISGLALTIRDENNQCITVPQQQGEVFVTGDYLMLGYYQQAEKNALTLTPFGLATGDIGFLDADGFLYLVGRKDDIFKSAGEKVSTQLLAAHLKELEMFDDLAIMPVPNALIGLVPYLIYVLKQGHVFDRKQVIQHLQNNVSSAALPKGFIEVPTIPRTGSGKINKQLLQDIVSRYLSNQL